MADSRCFIHLSIMDKACSHSALAGALSLMEVARRLMASLMARELVLKDCQLCGSLLFAIKAREAMISCWEASSIVRVADRIGSWALAPASLMMAGTEANSGDMAY